MWYACQVQQRPVPFWRRLVAALVMDGLLLGFLLLTWLAAQAASELLL